MKKTILAITFLLCSILVGSCGDSSNSASQENQPKRDNSVIASQTNSKSNSENTEKLTQQDNPKPINDSIKNDNPTFGTIKEMQNGDLKCYVSVVDRNGKLYESVGAIFDVCEPDKYVNKNVNLFYGLENVNDCQSAEPCGKTIKEWLITKIEIRD